MKVKKCSLLFLLVLVISGKLYSLSVGVIEPENLKNILTNDLKELWFDNTIDFEEIKEFKEDLSVPELSLFAKRENFDFIIYGFSDRTDLKCSVELRFLNVEKRKVEKIFYAADSADLIERLVNTLANHMHDYLCERFSIQRTEFQHFYKLDLTFSLGYWTYTSSKWNDLFWGTVTSNTGVEFHPALDFQFLNNDSVDFSLAFNVGYSLGVGRDGRYDALLHDVNFSLPVIFNWNPTAIHSLRFGLGPAFQLGFVDWTPLYENEEVKKIYQWGMTSFIQGRVFVSPRFGLSLGIGETYYFIRENVPEFSAAIGIVFTPYKKVAVR